MHSLVLNLVVQVSGEPIVEQALLDITRASQLHGDPVPPLVRVYLHGQVADLGHPCEPVALQETNEEVPAEAGPESTQQVGKGQVEKDVEYTHPDKILDNNIAAQSLD